jgi:hypothetical protein
MTETFVKFSAATYECAGVYGRHKLRRLAFLGAFANPAAITTAEDLALAIFPSLRRIAMR